MTYEPIMFKSGWVLEEYLGWSVAGQNDLSKLYRRSLGPFRRWLLLTREGDLTLLGPRGLRDLVTVSDLDDAVPESELRSRRLREVSGPRWMGAGTFVIPLAEDEDEIWKRISSRERTKINRAEREGVEVAVHAQPTEAHCREFSRLYDPLARERALEPVTPGFLRGLADSGNLRVVLGSMTGDVVVANLVLRLGDSAIFLHGARSNDALGGATHLAHWETARALRGEGTRWYDLGLVPSADPDNGIYRFKKSLGGFFVDHGREYAAASPIVDHPYRALRSIRDRLRQL